MKLLTARARMFQNIIDSGKVAIEGDVTCLVGKNESGKTAFLQALRRLNPAQKAGAPFDPSEHYPRWSWKGDEKAKIVDDTVPIEVTLALDPEDVTALEDALGPKVVVVGDTITVGKNYANRWTHSAPVDEAAAAKFLAGQVPKGHPTRKDAQQAKTLVQLYNALNPGGSEGEAEETSAEPAEGEPSTDPEFDELLERVDALSEEGGLEAAAWEVLQKRLPRFFYFGEYDGLAGRVALSRILSEDRANLTPDENTAVALLHLAGVEESDLREGNYERRVAELEASANEISKQVFKYWTQSRQLKVRFDVDKEIEEDSDTGVQSIVEWYLDVRLEDLRHGYTTNFETRSHGFQWFFSFVAAFTEFEDVPERVIVLLDEPALALHARAQNDFLRFINERLAAKHQVIYSTHSPWMIEPTELRRARLVEEDPNDADAGAKITSDVLATDPDTIFPLYAALGYDLAQNLFVGLNNLVVEGTSDVVYLTELSRRLEKDGRSHLDLAKWTIVPTGGAGRVATFVALLGAKLSVTVLVDTDAKLNQELTSLITKGILEDRRLVTVGQVTSAAKADIEDLFSTDDYLKLYNAAFKKKVKPEDLDSDTALPIVKRFGGDFEHGDVAEQLLRNPALVDDLDEETLARFEKLFDVVNGTLS